MTTATILLLLALGLLLIVKGGDIFVEAASWMAEKTGIPRLIIGATVVSLATTLPEMLVSFLAAGEGKVDMAIGNAVGSATVNIGLIMGIALICLPMAIRRRDYLVKSALMLGAAAVLVLAGFAGEIGLLPGLLLFAIFAAAMADNVHHARLALQNQAPPAQNLASGLTAGGCLCGGPPAPGAAEMAPDAAPSPEIPPAAAGGGRAANQARPGKETGVNIAKFVLGAAAIIIGSQLLVDNGSALALLLGVPERIIAISVVAIGTSLPELVTTISAIAKKQCTLSVGNIIGANIFDLTLILPVSALIAGRPLPVASQFARLDLPVCLLVGCLALLPALITKKFHRWQGIALVVVYVAYLAYTTLGPG